MYSVMHIIILFMIYKKSMIVWEYIYELRYVFYVVWKKCLYASKPLALFLS